MSNMSYCRFRNTNLDVQDCMETLIGLRDAADNIEWLKSHDGDQEEIEECEEIIYCNSLGASEARAATDMIRSFLDAMEDLGVIDGYDSYKVDEIIEQFSK